MTVKIGLQAGGRPYYDLTLVRANGKRITAAHGIRDKREAEWLARTLKEALVAPTSSRAQRGTYSAGIDRG